MSQKKDKMMALITGASGEIGSAIAKLLAENNIDLILQYKDNRERIIEVEKSCKEFGINTYLICADFNNIQSVGNLFKEIESNRLSPNILINAAGVASYGLIQDTEYKEWEKLINVNLMSAFFCAKNLVSGMVNQKFGRIINISSIWGEKGAANEVAYSMTKGAINTFTKALAQELAPSGITVNAIAPGIVASKMMNGFTDEELEELKAEIPMKRFARPEEIAKSVLFLIQPDASYITGQIIKIDGGWI